MTSEWNHSTINDVCVLVTDGSHSSPKSVNDGKYMVSVKDFTDYGFDFASCRMISNDDYVTGLWFRSLYPLCKMFIIRVRWR